VTGQVVLTSQFFDTGLVTEQQLTTTATSLKPAGVSLPNSPLEPQISGQQAAAQVIAAAIANKQGVATLSGTQTQQIMTGFANAGFLQINGPGGSSSLVGQATMAVVVVPGTVPPAKTSGPFNLALISLAEDMQERARAPARRAVAGSGPRSAIDAVTSGAAGVTLTTVDNADMATGQIIVAQALADSSSPTRRRPPTGFGRTACQPGAQRSRARRQARRTRPERSHDDEHAGCAAVANGGVGDACGVRSPDRGSAWRREDVDAHQPSR
jgi:hypothetical protein